MANKEVKFSAKLDMAGLEAQLQDVKRKMQELNQPMAQMQQGTSQRLQNSGLGGAMSQQSQAAYKQAMAQNRKDMDQSIQEQARGQERLNKIIDQRIGSLKRLQDAQSKMTAGSQEELKIKERIARVEENNARMKDTYRRRDADLNQALDARDKNQSPWERMKGAYQGGGIGGAAKQGATQLGGSGGLAAGIAGIISGLATVGLMANQIYKDSGKMPITTASNNGSAVQGIYGRDVQNVYSGRTSFEQMFNPERSKAAQVALNNRKVTQSGETADMLLGLAMKTGIGATVGSAVPILGTAAGAASGLSKGVYDIWNNDRQRSKLLSPFSQTHEDQYNSIVAKQMASDYNESLQGQKDQNPFKTGAVQDYEQNYARNLSSQRMMGSNDEGFYGQGGFLRQNTNAGFTPELALSMANSINGAGGSTRMTQDSVFGNQLSRGLNLTNSGAVLGSLSGSMGSAESTKQATIRLLAEGTKLGLDDSKFAEENRRFTQSAADIIARSGATGKDDVSRLSKGIGDFVGENTNRGIDAAMSAHDTYQKLSSETTGPRGVMRAAGFMKDQYLKQLSPFEQQALMKIPSDDLNRDNPMIQSAADKANTDPQTIIDSITGVDKNSQSRFGQHDSARNRIQSYLKGKGITNFDDSTYNSLPKELRHDYAKMMTSDTNDLDWGGNKKQRSMANAAINQGLSEDPAIVAARENGIKEHASMQTGNIGDNTIAAAAGDAGTVLTNFQGMRTEMNEAAKSAASFTDQIRMMNAELVAALEASKTGKSSKTLEKTLEDIMSRAGSGGNQVQTGKVSK